MNSKSIFIFNIILFTICIIKLSYQLEIPNQKPKCAEHEQTTPKLKPGCNQEEFGKRCKDQVCSLVEAGGSRYIKDNCTYAEYKEEYCECCKHCPYPPPKNGVIGCSKVAAPEAKPEPIICPNFQLALCTPEMYIEEICETCKHCPGYV